MMVTLPVVSHTWVSAFDSAHKLFYFLFLILFLVKQLLSSVLIIPKSSIMNTTSFAQASHGMQYQLQIYIKGMQNVKPQLPVSFEELEQKAKE
jgi:hypothetical protein